MVTPNRFKKSISEIKIRDMFTKIKNRPVANDQGFVQPS